MEMLQLVSISFEMAIVFLGLKIAMEKKKHYGWAFAFTFAVYVLYDLANLFRLGVPIETLRIFFFLASASILWGVWKIYKSKK